MIGVPSLSVPTQSAGTTPEKEKLPPLFACVTFESSQNISAFGTALLPCTTATPFWTSAVLIVIVAWAADANTLTKPTKIKIVALIAFLPEILRVADSIGEQC
jgi:hypothetical protein